VRDTTKLNDPWYFPGRKEGTEDHPIPSGYPTISQVIEACCEVFNEHGHRYADRSPLTTWMITDPAYCRKAKVTDCRVLICYIIREHVRWIKTPSGPPHPYTKRTIARELGSLNRRNVARYHERASLAIGRDQHLTTLYFASLERLQATNKLHFPRELSHPRAK
jgi:hypothetical protein